MAYPQHARPTECRIIDRIINRALEYGAFVSVFDSEEWALRGSDDYEAITAEVHATDITTLRFTTAEGNRLGDVILVHGNDDDVVHDHTDNLFTNVIVGT